MFPLIRTVLHRDYSTPRTASIRGNIPFYSLILKVQLIRFWVGLLAVRLVRQNALMSPVVGFSIVKGPKP